jgi:ubiquitin carboxyl-terminal hydrolase 20/33
LGNTCYLNAALQALLNCPELTQYFNACKGFVIGAVGTKSDGKASLARNYMQLVHHVWVDDSIKEYVAPTGVLHAIKQASFIFSLRKIVNSLIY